MRSHFDALLLIILAFNALIELSISDYIDANDEIERRIAIIGGGIGGTASAYFLKKLSQSDGRPSRMSVELFEKSGELGGRLATRTINGKHYETGGSIIHERNHYAVSLARELKLSKRERDANADKLCISNGRNFVFCESNWTWITYFKIWLRYGLDVTRLQSKVAKIIDKFEKIYNLQDYKVVFESVDELLDAMSPTVNNLTKTRYKDYLMNNGFSKNFMNELVQAITLVNYGQDITIPAFVGVVSFAGAGSHLWSIKGGNKQLPIGLASVSKANILLNSNVESVTYLEENLFEITAVRQSGEKFTQRYNSVIVATPLINSEIKFLNFTVNINENIQLRKYHRTVSTLVAGIVNNKFKGRDVLTDNQSTFFTSLARVYAVDDSVDEKVPVYKLFSQQPLSSEQLSTIFDDIQQVDITDWFAYPEYDTIALPLPRFVLYPGVYHTNAIEWAASAMEMSLIGGKNAALLAFSQLGGKTSKVYADKITRKFATDEL